MKIRASPGRETSSTRSRLGSLPVRCALRGGCEHWNGVLLLCGHDNVWQDGQQEAWLIRLASPELGSFGWPDVNGD